MEDQVNKQGQTKAVLIRGAFMLLFLVAARIASILVVVITVFQFFSALIVKKTNDNAKRFGHGLSRYLAQTVQFVSCNTEQKPWPFSPWPTMEQTADVRDSSEKEGEEAE